MQSGISNGPKASERSLQRQLNLLAEILDGIPGKGERNSYLENELLSSLQYVKSKAESFDPASVIGCLRMRSAVALHSDADGGGFDYAVALIEVAALAIYCGTEPRDSKDYMDVLTPTSGSDLAEDLFAELQRIRTLSTLLQLPSDGRLEVDELLNVRHSTGLQWIRETTYRTIQADLYEDLFGAPAVEELVADACGYTYAELAEVMSWISNFADGRLGAAFEELGEVLTSTNHSETAGRERFEAATNRIFAPRFHDVTLSAAEIASRTRIREEIVEKILHDFSIDLTAYSVEDVKQFLAEGRNPLFGFPLVKERNDRYLVLSESLLLPSVKRNLEAVLLENPIYGRHRGELVEDRLIKVLRDFLPAAQIYAGVQYGHPEKGRGEADAILIMGDVAIVFEVKAATIFKLGASAGVKRFRRTMWQNIHKASKQVDDLRALIEDDRQICGERGEVIDLTFIREVHTVIVTLEELLDLSTQPLDLVDSNVLHNADQLPWLVSIGDLTVILELIDEPSEFLVYLRRRRDPVIARRFVSTDELDLFLAFRKTGLWVDEEGDSTPYLVAPMTAEIDVWMNGVSERKPRIKDTPLLQHVQRARNLNLAHWFEFGATLLSLDETSQERAQIYIDQVVALSKSVGTPRMVALPVADRKPPRYGGLLVFQTTTGSNRLKVRNELTEFTRSERSRGAFSRAFGCILDDGGQVVDLVYSSCD